MSDAVELALLRQRQEQDEARIATLEERLAAIDRKVLTGQIGLVVLIALGTFFGWLLSVSEKVRSWLH